MSTGIVKNKRVAVNRDGDDQARLLDVEIDDADDVQTVELATPAGIDCNPPVGSKAFIFQEGKAWKICFAIDDGITPSADDGELRLYSIAGDPPVVKALIHLKNGGDIEIDADGGGNIVIDSTGKIILNGGAGTAVEFGDLKTAFDQLKSDFNTFVTTKYNLHTHGGAVAVPTLTGTASTADIDPAESDTVRLP